MTRVWVIRESIPEFMILTPPYAEGQLISQLFCKIHNESDYPRLDYCYHRHEISALPRIQLEFRRKESPWDYFTWRALMFVSEYMREGMALGASDVRFHDIDDSRSPPAVREMKYQVMEPLRELSISDPAGFEAEFQKDMEAAMAPPSPKWMGPRGLSIQQDVTPPHELFFDSHYSRVFCTDAFALRILQADCFGIAFAEPTHLYGEHCRFRTLQGVEEYVSFDKTKTRLNMKLVEEIP